jgi:YfiH family protein
MNIGSHRNDTAENVQENFNRICAFLGSDPKLLALTRQDHGNTVRRIRREDITGSTDHHDYPFCDGLITDVPGVTLVVFTADCTPILLHDRRTGAMGAVHAGWRGTANGIVREAVQQMQTAFGTRPEDLSAAIGPNIAQCCFQTDADVPEAMLAVFGQRAQTHIRREGVKYYVNLKTLNALHLRDAGVQNISVCQDCTACQPDRFWSHRIHGDSRGAQGAMIVCKEGY